MYQHEVFFESAKEAIRLHDDMKLADMKVGLTSFLLDYNMEYHRVTLVSEYDNQVITEYLGSEDYDYDEVITTNL
ncbi:hypothetical protein [Escherichia phage ULINTec6]|uniref:Uncharacterized protein n=2 Tax=Vectrevirus TaxID=2732928 RepID=A0AAE8Y2Y8_9CAUD|nr:hypothetical protein [Escherichia phage ULINTec6]UCR91866.1 hypothetical protein [Escherichia phage ULINTec7]